MGGLLLTAGVLVLAGATRLEGSEVPATLPLTVGDRVWAEVGRQYRTELVSIDGQWTRAVGEVVRRDKLTVTIASPDGRETRYPTIRARFVGRVVGLDAEGL